MELMYIIKTVKGDITKITDVRAVVNAANNSLLSNTYRKVSIYKGLPRI